MNEHQAKAIADAVSEMNPNAVVNYYNSGGNVWLVTIATARHHLVVISGDVVCEYETLTGMDNGDEPINTINLY